MSTISSVKVPFIILDIWSINCINIKLVSSFSSFILNFLKKVLKSIFFLPSRKSSLPELLLKHERKPSPIHILWFIFQVKMFLSWNPTIFSKLVSSRIDPNTCKQHYWPFFSPVEWLFLIDLQFEPFSVSVLNQSSIEIQEPTISYDLFCWFNCEEKMQGT